MVGDGSQAMGWQCACRIASMDRGDNSHQECLRQTTRWMSGRSYFALRETTTMFETDTRQSTRYCNVKGRSAGGVPLAMPVLSMWTAKTPGTGTASATRVTTLTNSREEFSVESHTRTATLPEAYGRDERTVFRLSETCRGKNQRLFSGGGRDGEPCGAV